MSTALAFEDTEPEERSHVSRGATVGIAAWFDGALPRIFGYFVTRVGGRVAVAEDLTQETMLAAVKSASTPDDPGSIMPWLYGIARHKLMDQYRREDRERRHFGGPIDQDDGDIAESAALPDLDLESLPVRDAVIATLDALAPRQRAALVLRYFDGCDVPTTAESLNVSVHAAESLLARARTSFRRHYQARNGDPS